MSPTASELERMRGQLQTQLPDRCTIYRPGTSTGGYDELGGRVDDDQVTLGDPVATDVPIGLSPVRTATGDERTSAGGVWSEAEWIATLPAGRDIRSNDVLEVHDVCYDVIRDTSGRSYELQVKVGLVKRGGTEQ